MFFKIMNFNDMISVIDPAEKSCAHLIEEKFSIPFQLNNLICKLMRNFTINHLQMSENISLAERRELKYEEYISN